MSTASGKNDSREKAKLAAIPVLLLVFIYVVYSQFAGEEESLVESPPVAIATGTPNTTVPVPQPPVGNTYSVSVVDSLENAAVPLSEREWYESPLEQIIQHDPFLKTDQLKSEADKLAEVRPELTEVPIASVDEQRRVEDRLEGVKTKILIKSSKGSAAYVGTRLVREGDVWEEGMKIKSIDLDGVVVAPQRDEEPTPEPSDNPSAVGDKLRSFFPMLAPPPQQ
ncbi:MAG: hypothetical protein CMJ46_09805 [Planctomyces sp.]|nr:hypothetical protein [Planctomyces sp.]